MEDYLETASDEEKLVLSTIADYAFDLGYQAKKDKSKTPGYTFKHSKIKKLILRFSTSKGKPIIKLKFFAAQQYSRFFLEALKEVIEEFDYRYTGCYGCRKCDGTEGYLYRYQDGREYYRCGTELIELSDVKNVPLVEFLELFKTQHEYYLSQLNVHILRKSVI